MPKIIATFAPSNLTEIDEAGLADFSGVDMVEWRADAMPADEILLAAPKLFEKLAEIPILFTLRSSDEGGQFDQPDLIYTYILRRILTEFQPAFVDLEALSKPDALTELKEFLPKLWLSYHNFKEMPENLISLMANLAAEKPAAVKIAVTVKSKSDLWQLLQTAEIFRESFEIPLIAIAMGKLGRISRLLDSPWTFVSTDAAQAAPYGQFTLAETKTILEMLDNDQN